MFLLEVVSCSRKKIFCKPSQIIFIWANEDRGSYFFNYTIFSRFRIYLYKAFMNVCFNTETWFMLNAFLKCSGVSICGLYLWSFYINWLRTNWAYEQLITNVSQFGKSLRFWKTRKNIFSLTSWLRIIIYRYVGKNNIPMHFLNKHDNIHNFFETFLVRYAV